MPVQGKRHNNADYEWDDFDPSEYLERNYSVLRDDDRMILDEVRGHFVGAGVRLRGTWACGIDVGSGSNLYPALTMLPFCKEITLSDRATPNIDWLRHEVRSYSRSWDPFWRVLAQSAPYSDLPDPRAELCRKAAVRTADLFELPERRWDLGTMFFVAESISAEWREFRGATHRFLRSLKRDAPFAAAFMASSTGYEVAGHHFPAVAIGVGDVRECLEDVAHAVRIHVWPADFGQDEPLRDGYEGMILALGRAGEN